MNKKYIETGGAGDAWICFLKLQQETNCEIFHIESTNAVKSVMDYVKEQHQKIGNNFTFECDPNYIENYKNGKWKDRIPVSSGVDGWCPLKGNTKIELEAPFINHHYNRSAALPREIEYDYCIQTTAGAKDNRNWKFDPRHLKKILDSSGKRVILIGTDRKYYDEKDESNLVGKTASVSDALAVIRKSNTFIGLSGFLSFWALSNRINTIHYQIDEDHNKRYIHSDWSQYIKNIKFGTIQEILKEINESKRSMSSL